MSEELSTRVDLDWYRKQAKQLVRAYREGSVDAVTRVERTIGPRSRERFGLTGAQWLLAREHGFRSWAELRQSVEAQEATGKTPLQTAFLAARPTLGERGEVLLDSGLVYGGTAPILVLVRKRGPKYLLSDAAGAVQAAGRPAGWLDVARQVVEERHWLNVNRRGVVFVPVAESRSSAWLLALLDRIADASLDLYEALLELDE